MLKRDKLKETMILIKYGGNAMIDDDLKIRLLKNICHLKKKGNQIVVVHGGGPFIKQALKEAKIESEFIDGHRKTTAEAFEHVEMALKGKVNSNLVNLINTMGCKSIGLSGKDGKMVIATKRLHRTIINGNSTEVDLGQVGDVSSVNTSLIRILLENDYIPVITCIASDQNGNEFNINADMFAGYIAGALSADRYIVLTDVDGVLKDKNDHASIIQDIRLAELNDLLENKIIAGGMVPKVESCIIALKQGAGSAMILNGTKPEQLEKIFDNQKIGTLFSK